MLLLKFVQSVDLERSSAFLRVRKEVTITNGEIGIISVDNANIQTWQSFDEERAPHESIAAVVSGGQGDFLVDRDMVSQTWRPILAIVSPMI